MWYFCLGLALDPHAKLGVRTLIPSSWGVYYVVSYEVVLSNNNAFVVYSASRPVTTIYGVDGIPHLD